MSAPFPGMMNPDPGENAIFQRAEILVIEERGVHVPSWYIRHEKDGDGIVVTQNGVPFLPQFTVAQVPPERRWAIDPTGEVLPTQEFAKRFIEWREEWFTKADPDVETRGIPQHWSAKNAHIPSVENFVKVQVDPRDRSKYIPMGYDPRKTAGALPDKLYDHEGEYVEGEARVRMLIDQYRKDQTKLMPHEITEVENRLGIKSGPEGNALAQLELLTKLRESGAIDDATFASQASELLGASPKTDVRIGEVPESVPEPQAAPEPAPETSRKKRKAPMKAMPCGEVIYAFHQKRHARSCEAPACAEARRQEG